VDRITRTCSLGIAAALMLAPAGRANVEDRAELSAYARARAADSFGAAGDAAESYAAALRLAPDNELLAARALAQALAAGDRPLALQAAAVLQRVGQLAPDARLLLLVEALRTGNPRQAKLHADALAGLEPFAFMAPILNAWIAFDAKRRSALPALAGADADGLAAAYAAEHRPLLLLASGKTKEGVDELLKITAAGGARAQRLRIAGAAFLARKNKDEQALRLLEGDEAPIAAARAAVRANKPLRGEIASGRAGVGEFLVRLALDLDRQEVDALALAYAQLATFAAPENSETWLVASDLLARRGESARALALLANVPADDPFADGLADRRIRLLTATGDKARALTEAQAATVRAGAGVADWARFGELLAEEERHREAAAAYAKALELPKSGDQPEWALWLLHGSALLDAGDWAGAKTSLERARKIAPDQPLVLNYLGYSQLERRENLDEAERLIREASRLQPDNHAITDSLGWTYYIRGNVPKAIELLEKAAAGEPADPAINEHLGDAYYTAGRRFEARYAWEAALLYAEGDAATRLRAKIEKGLTKELAAP
jgi:predicted Zn-dependent protease